jgi:hypothetical protein
MDEDGRLITEHHQKAAILWKAFKQRLGTTSNTHMMFELKDLIPHNDLSSLDVPFTNEEIDEVIKHMPNDKVPGPDGFNGKFIKKYWRIIKGQFYELCRKFYDNKVDIKSLNTAYITLIPKITNPMTANDFWPISLVSMAIKVITKLIANRVQKIIIPILHKNQYGFIKNKTIHDCLNWSFEYLHLCQK